MTDRVSRWLVFVVLLGLPSVAAAQGASGSNPDAQSIKVGGTIFYDYTYTREPKSTDADGNRISPNAFNVARAYLNITGTLSHVVSFRITPDAKRETGIGSSLNGSLTFRLKYAYAQFNMDDWMPAGTQIRVGIIQTPFIDSQEGVYRYRFQGTVFAERDGGMSSADAGVSIKTPLKGNYGDVQVGLYNGEGYSKAESNDQKSIQLRATIRPLPNAEGPVRGLRVTAFYDADHYQQNAERRRFIAAGMFEHARLNAGVDFMVGRDQPSVSVPVTDSKGVSFFVTPFFHEKGNGWEGLFRFDHWDADTDVAGTQNRIIVGGAYWFPHPGGSATAALLFDYERVSYADFAIAPARQQRFAVHGLINF
ncbi:MAG: porin [Vicinamibacterales bacterium]